MFSASVVNSNAQPADQVYVHELTVEDGLAQSNVNVILKDSDGLIWLGTDDGLNLFDSHNLKTYRHDSNDPYSLSENEVVSLLEDSQGRLWVGTAHGGGLNLFNRKGGKFLRYLDDNVADNISIRSKNAALCIIEDASQNIWVGTHDGIRVLKKGDSKFEFFG